MKRRNIFKLALGGIVGAFTGVRAAKAVAVSPVAPVATTAFSPYGYMGDFKWVNPLREVRAYYAPWPGRYNTIGGERIYPQHIVDGKCVANPKYESALYEEVYILNESRIENLDGRPLFRTEIRLLNDEDVSL